MYADMHPDILLRMLQVEQRILWKEAEMQRLLRSARGDSPGLYRQGLQALRRTFAWYTAGTPQQYANAARAHAAGSKQTAHFRSAPQRRRDDVCTERVGSTR